MLTEEEYYKVYDTLADVVSLVRDRQCEEADRLLMEVFKILDLYYDEVKTFKRDQEAVERKYSEELDKWK